MHFQSFDADKLLGFGKINGALVKTAAENSSHNAVFFHLQERALLHTMLEGTQNVPGLRHIPGVHVYVDTEDLTHRDLIVAMGIDGLDMTRCVEEYQKRGVTTFERVNTSVYSKRIVEAVGLTGAIRVSPLHCHTVADIETYLRVTQELAQAFAK